MTQHPHVEPDVAREPDPAHAGDAARTPAQPLPALLVVMGVSGAGKSTLAGLLAQRLGYALLEGDDLHSARNVARMRRASRSPTTTGTTGSRPSPSA